MQNTQISESQSDFLFYLKMAAAFMVTIFVARYLLAIRVREIEGKNHWGTLLGAGAFGTVEKYHYRNNSVALKIPKTDVASHAIQNEIQQLKRISEHENIVKIYGITEINNKPSIMMEYMPGGNLRNLLDRWWWRAPNWKTKLNLSKQIAAGLVHLHSHSTGYFSKGTMVHQDLKSENVVLSADHKTAKIADFGIARYYYKWAVPIVDLTIYSHSLDAFPGGTFSYIAPEVLGSDNYNEKADIFSLGVLLWEIATRQRPSRTEQEIRDGEFHSFRNAPDKCKFFAPIINKCITNSSNKRPKASEIFAELNKLDKEAIRVDAQACLIM